MLRSVWPLAVIAWSVVLAQTNVDQCSCGFVDINTRQLFTESIVVYFNETTTLPTDIFRSQEFTHKKEKGWTSIFRQGASLDNVVVGNDSQPDWSLGTTDNPYTLELFVDGYTSDHRVTGGAVSTLRQDILYGSFRASMRSPHPYAGGSALSMLLSFDDADTIEIDLCNADNSDADARVTALMDAEYQYADPSFGLSYNTIKNGSTDIAAASPWDYMDVQIDWLPDSVNYKTAGWTIRSVDSHNVSIPDVPVPLAFKHWSNGDANFMKGPPVNRSGANVAYIRAFFNSSSWTLEQHSDFDQRCQQSLPCSMDDLTLRGFTNFSDSQTLPYNTKSRDHDLWTSSVLNATLWGFFLLLALGYPILRRFVPWQKIRSIFARSKRQRPESVESVEMSPTEPYSSSPDRSFYDRGPYEKGPYEKEMYGKNMGRYSDSTLAFGTNTQTGTPSRMSVADGISVADSHENYNVMYVPPSGQPTRTERASRGNIRSSVSTANTYTEMSPKHAIDDKHPHSFPIHGPAPVIAMREIRQDSSTTLNMAKVADPTKADKQDLQEGHGVATTSDFHAKNEVLKKDGLHVAPTANPGQPVLAPANVRIDYLAGVVAFACICVSFVHFVLTFLPAVNSTAPVAHSASDSWARKTIAPYLLSEAWIGPFFTTSARFLSARYLRGGKLSDIGNKALLRAPRMVVPVIIISLLQYIFILIGMTGVMVYLPSISWTVWPYVTAYPSFGGYINSMIDISYLIPNAAPAVVPHYCIGVLWTIPIQLQNSYLVLIAAVMIREVKTHWKRFAFYLFCICNHWYAFSWGSCFWMGLMLSDLSVTYKYAKWIQARWWAQYGLCTAMWLVAIASSTVFLVNNDLNYDFLTKERGIHIEPTSGLPFAQTAENIYPDYFEPRLNTILLAGSLQVIVELSVIVQKFLSMKMWIWIFPHIMTIYLIHGFIFWTIGATVCIGLSLLGVPYSVNMLVTVIVCYGTLAIAAPVVTKVTDRAAKWTCKMLWKWAEEEPLPSFSTVLKYYKKKLTPKSRMTDRAKL